MFVVWPLIVFGILGVTQASIGRVEVDCARAPEVRIGLPTGVDWVEVAARPSPGTWLDIEEAGVDLQVEGEPTDTFKITVPTRLGRYWIPSTDGASIRLRRDQSSKGKIELPLHCRRPSIRELAWYRRASDLSRNLMPVPVGIPKQQLLETLQGLVSDATEASARVLSAHLRAQVLYSSDNASEAASAFEVAELAWKNIADDRRAIAARVGRVEDLIRAARLDDALSLIRMDASGDYFGTRLAASRCQILRYKGQLSESATCYQATIAALGSQGEMTEMASMLLDQADVYRKMGRHSLSEDSAKRSRRLAVGPYAPLVRGRASLFLSDIHFDDGNIPEVLDDIHKALDDFESVRTGRWQANALMRAAKLYLHLNAEQEAGELLARARTLLSEKDAPARVAQLWLLEADGARRAQDSSRMLAAARKAQGILEPLGMSLELESARRLIADASIRIGNPHDAEDVLKKYRGTQDADWWILKVDASLAKGHLSEAKRWLDRLQARRDLRLSQQLEYEDRRSRLLALKGQKSLAVKRSVRAAERIRSHARATDNPLLAYLLWQMTIPFRSLAASLLLQGDGNAETMVVDAWYWLMQSYPTRPPATHAISGERVHVFDRELTKELLASAESGPIASAPTAQALLAILSDRSGDLARKKHEKESLPALADFQDLIGERTALIAHFDADGAGALLWVTKHDAKLVPALPSKELRTRVDALVHAASMKATPISRIDTIAGLLASDLFGVVGASDQDSLLVATGSPIAAIPWSLLKWPDGRALIDVTDVSLVNFSRTCCSNLQSKEVRVLISDVHAGQQDATGPAPIASQEDRLVAQGIAREPYLIRSSAVTGAQSIFRAMEAPGVWLHVAAHGRTDSAGVGRSGIWIPDASEKSPAFLSGLDIISRDVRSRLIVLDSCDLAREQMSSSTPLNFTDALMYAGAENVVASRWPVSDSAAATWVPVFYRQASKANGQFARALRLAQIELQRTRRYRHPFYWSSLALRSSFPLRSKKPTSSQEQP